MIMRETVDEAGRLSDNIVYFGRVLRHAGMPVGPASIVDAVRAVETAGIGSRDDFYWCLHAIFVTKHDQSVVFDEAFSIFWRSRELVEKMLQILSPVAPERPKEKEKPKAGATRVSKAFMNEEATKTDPKPEIEVDAQLTVSGKEVLRTKDFAQMDADEIAAAQKAVKELVLPVPPVRTRRMKPAARGVADMRRTLRQSLRSGGDLIVPAFRERAEIVPPVVALIDISGSMANYSRLFLHFLHALTDRHKRVHTFVFGTRLTNVTRQLRNRDPDEALEEAAGEVADWSGGTRIATALHTFNRDWSRRVLSGGPIVILMTDGLERDSAEDLGAEMDRLHRSCRRLIWLNPLLRYDRFEPRAQGIRAMLPHVDEFRTIHSLNAVSDLCAALQNHHLQRRAA